MKWVLAESDDNAVAALADEADLPRLVARLLVNRGIVDPSDARSFLSCDLSALSDPGIFSQMNKAVDRVRSALSSTVGRTLSAPRDQMHGRRLDRRRHGDAFL